MRRQWSDRPDVFDGGPEAVGTGDRMRRQWSWVDDLGQEDPSGCRKGEQDAEAGEGAVRGRQAPEVMSERRTGCGGSGAFFRADLGCAHPLVGTKNWMRRQWSLPGRKRP